MQNSKSEQAELIFHLGTEFASKSYFRRPTAPDQWEYWYEGSAMGTDDDYGDKSLSFKSEIFTSWDDLKRDFDKDKEWIMWSPLNVHPEYRERLRIAVRHCIPQLRDDLRPYWLKSCQRRWRRELGLTANEEF